MVGHNSTSLRGRKFGFVLLNSCITPHISMQLHSTMNILYAELCGVLRCRCIAHELLIRLIIPTAHVCHILQKDLYMYVWTSSTLAIRLNADR